MTLFFPPNAAVSSLLRSARLSALRAVAAGMEDGSLNGSHDGIRSLIFLDSSHKLDAILPPDKVVQAEPEVRGGNGGTIALGVLVPILLLTACAVGFVLYRHAPALLRIKRIAASPRARRRQSPDGEELITEVVKPSKKERRRKSKSSKKGRSRGRPSRRSGAGSDLESADGTASRTQSDDDGESSVQEDAAAASEDEGKASNSADESSSSSSSSDSSEDEADGAPDGSDSSSSDEDDFDASANVLYSTFESSLKEETRKAREKKLERRRARIRRRLKRHNKKINRNVVMTGGEDGSVATGITGVHSVSSSATDMVRNGAGGGVTRDDASVMTGISAATEMVRNTSSVPRGRANLGDDASAVTGVSAATARAGNVVPKY